MITGIFLQKMILTTVLLLLVDSLAECFAVAVWWLFSLAAETANERGKYRT